MSYNKIRPINLEGSVFIGIRTSTFKLVIAWPKQQGVSLIFPVTNLITVFQQVNFVVLLLVLREILNTEQIKNKSKADKVRASAKALVTILPLLGLTWIFGLLAYGSASVIIKYLFAIFNSLQGLLIFIFHCVLNKQASVL